MKLLTDEQVNSAVLSEGKKLYDQGDKTQILKCLSSCLYYDRPIPPWLKQAFQNAYRAKSAYTIKSWDEVFGRPIKLKKGARLETERRNRSEISSDIYKRVVERHGAGEPIDKELFASVGKDFGVGGTIASQLYYAVVNARREQDKFEKELVDAAQKERERKTSGKI